MTARRPLLAPLVPFWAAGTALKNKLFSSGVRSPRQLLAPVLSVGSLSAGGAGKTPFVICLARLLQEQGFDADVLSRGYGRAAKAVEEVDLSDPEPARRFGDEPVEMTEAGLRVYVGADRFAAGQLAEARNTQRAPLHVLDDGFQHRQLARTLDLVLLTVEDVQDQLLPAGNLREPLTSLRRADIIIVREEEADALAPTIIRFSDAEIWTIRRRLELSEPRIGDPVAFCAIARPGAFFSMLRLQSVAPLATLAFPDHHAYTENDFEMIIEAGRQLGAQGFYTTAKDMAKISPAVRSRLSAVGPLCVGYLSVTLTSPQSTIDTLLCKVRKATNIP